MMLMFNDRQLILQNRRTGMVHEVGSAEQAAKMLRENPDMTEYPGSGTFDTLHRYYGVEVNGDRVDGSGLLQNLFGNPGYVPGQNSSGVTGVVNNLLFGLFDSE